MEQLLLKSLENESLSPAIPVEMGNALANTVISPLAEMDVYPRSIIAMNHCLYFLGRRGTQKYVGIITERARRAAVLGTPRSIRLHEQPGTPFWLPFHPAVKKIGFQ